MINYLIFIASLVDSHDKQMSSAPCFDASSERQHCFSFAVFNARSSSSSSVSSIAMQAVVDRQSRTVCMCMPAGVVQLHVSELGNLADVDAYLANTCC